MTYQAILVFAALLFILISLYRELFSPVLTFLITVTALGLGGVLTPSEILHGFANEQIAVVLLLLLLGEIIRKTQVIQLCFDKVFRKTSSYRGFMGKMMGLVSIFSAFLNNTPLVAVMMPYVHTWSKRNKISPSKLLIPLSYAAILGGCATLIGTSTNLIVNSLWVDQHVFPGAESLNLFDFFPVGGPMAVIGVLFLYFFGNRLLPDHADIISDFSEHTREYILEAQVPNGSALIGKTVREAGFSGDKPAGENGTAYYLIEIIRDAYRITPAVPDTVLKAGDVLLFAGDNETVAELLNTQNGLVIPEVRESTRRKFMEVLEIVVSHNSTLLQKRVRDVNFSGRFDASIVAIHRNGERVTGTIRETKLKAGDVLLLLAGPDFSSRSVETQDFYFISKVKEIHQYGPVKISVLLGGTVLAILLSAFKLVPLFLSLSVLLIVLLLLKVAHLKDIKRGFDYNLYVIIALSLALGKAMVNTGVAEMISAGVISLCTPFGKIGLLAGIYLITALLAAFITNKAAVAVIFPISMAAAHDLGLNPIPFVLVVSFAAAANFMTPLGYQTNLMVYGPGGYKFRDFLRIGAPLTLLYGVVTVAVLSSVYF